MDDQTDHSDADSGRVDAEKRNAEVRATSGPHDDPDVFLIEYSDGTVDYEPGTPMNQVLFGEGKYAEVQGTHEYDVGDVTVGLKADVRSDDYVITYKGVDIPVPGYYRDDVVEAVTSANPGPDLLDLYEEIIDGQVRRNVITKFLERFPDDRISVTADGWVVDDTFVVTYDATNHLVDIDPTDPYGDEVDDSKQAVYLDIDADDARTIVAPDGEQVELEPLEQEFLTAVEGLLYPEDYFGVELVDEIQQQKAEAEIGDLIEDLTDQADVTGFTDSKTGIHHGSSNHSFSKHRLSDLGVTDEVSDLLWAHDYDHTGVVELHMRKDELIARPDVDVFEHAQDDDETMWEKVERTKENAPIPDDVRQTLNEMYQ